MNIAVLIKWVPEPQGTPRLGEDHLLVREGADGALDPGDEYGLERALQLVERDGGEVVRRLDGTRRRGRRRAAGTRDGGRARACS